MQSRTFRLFSMPSTVSGIARVFDFYGSFDRYNSDASERIADFDALRADWAMVGNDLAASMLQLNVMIPNVEASEFAEIQSQLEAYIVDADAQTQPSLTDHAV